MDMAATHNATVVIVAAEELALGVEVIKQQATGKTLQLICRDCLSGRRSNACAAASAGSLKYGAAARGMSALPLRSTSTPSSSPASSISDLT